MLWGGQLRLSATHGRCAAYKFELDFGRMHVEWLGVKAALTGWGTNSGSPRSSRKSQKREEREERRGKGKGKGGKGKGGRGRGRRELTPAQEGHQRTKGFLKVRHRDQ